ncbi:MAG: hypothetical protein JJU05_01150 [Verrucomicrobia bacterium]|nr:hypothetical protein [Verrucomicrobiota bacterium]MCH8525909.1 hypothetical protein [Kiritimatiellia bacterium]
MNTEKRMRLDHWLSVLVSVLVNAALFTAMIFYISFEPSRDTPPSKTMVIEASVPEEITEMEIEIIDDLSELSHATDETNHWNHFDHVEIDFEMPPEVVDTASAANLDILAGLLTDIVSPITMLGAGHGVPAGGGIRGFGDEGGSGNDLVGTLYDLKRNRDGEARRFSFSPDLRRMIDAGFSGPTMRDFYRVPKQLRLSHLFIPRTPADGAPEAFGVADYMEPRGWVVHYQGYIQPSVPGSFRFVGDFDDVIIVMINGQVVLESNWGAPATDWRPQQTFRHPGLLGRNLVYGDWIQIDNRPHRIDLIIGENPGGHVGGLLLVQNEKGQYREAANGRPILPLFTLHPFRRNDVDRFSTSSFELELNNVPFFGLPMRPAASGTPAINDDLVHIELL